LITPRLRGRWQSEIDGLESENRRQTALFHGFLNFHSEKRRKLRKKLIEALTEM
jgi:hypothetical protein